MPRKQNKRPTRSNQQHEYNTKQQPQIKHKNNKINPQQP